MPTNKPSADKIAAAQEMRRLWEPGVSAAEFNALKTMDTEDALAEKTVPMAIADLFVEAIAMLQTGAHTGAYELWLIHAWERLTGFDFIRHRKEVCARSEVRQRVASAKED
jgi:hypothetical protein